MSIQLTAILMPAGARAVIANICICTAERRAGECALAVSCPQHDQQLLRQPGHDDSALLLHARECPLLPQLPVQLNASQWSTLDMLRAIPTPCIVHKARVHRGLCARRAPPLTGRPQMRIGCSSALVRTTSQRARSSPWRTVAAVLPHSSAPAASHTTTPAAWRGGTASPATSAAASMTWALIWTCPVYRYSMSPYCACVCFLAHGQSSLVILNQTCAA